MIVADYTRLSYDGYPTLVIVRFSDRVSKNHAYLWQHNQSLAIRVGIWNR